MKLKYARFRNWCFAFMGNDGNEGYTSDSLVTRYQAFKKNKGIGTVKGVPSIASASEVLRRDARFKRGENLSKGCNDDMVWVSPRVVWFLNSDNE